MSRPSCVGHSPPVSRPWKRLDSNSSSAAVALRRRRCGPGGRRVWAGRQAVASGYHVG